MDDHANDPQINSGFDGSYGLHFINSEVERELMLPALAVRYVHEQGASDEFIPVFIEQHKDSVIGLVTDSETNEIGGMILFDAIGFRHAAWVHVCFWKLTHAQRLSSVKLALAMLFDSFPQVLRAECFIPFPGGKTARFAKEIGGECIARIPYGDLYEGKPRDYLYYILRRPALG